MVRAPRVRAVIALAAGLAACRPAEVEPPRVLALAMARPENPEGVFLNEDLVFHFTDEVERASVTRDSVRVATRDGRPARGTLSVEGTRVRFSPAPVLARDLSDGGYLPATEYLVEIAGFPRVDGLRGARGEPLERTWTWTFRTVAARAGTDEVVFEDRDPDRVRPLRLFPPPAPGEARIEIDPQDALFLDCDEPLDPRSLLDGAFELLPAEPRAGRVGVRLRARLLENEPHAALRPRPAHLRSAAPDEAWEREPRAALLELRPERSLDRGAWRLAFHESLPGWTVLHLGGVVPTLAPVVLDARPRELGGRSVLDPTLLSARLQVAERGREAGRGELIEAFADARLRSTVPVPGYDGTASWTGSGRVEARWPAAAGNGKDGDVVLAGGDEPRTDVHAIALSLSQGQTTRLASQPGLVVLRAQASLRIHGRLERRTQAAVTSMTFEPGPLSGWLSAALALAPEDAARRANWTVIIAGGDLTIDGDVQVDTPLLLCAGGRIRVAGTVRAASFDQLFRLGEGGGEGMVATNVDALVIDAPFANPLRKPLRLAVYSGPIPPRGEVAEWLTAEAIGSEPGRAGAGGRWSVRYVPELLADEAANLGAVDHPRLLARPSPMHLLIELVVEPGPVWRPPHVDLVRLAWIEAAAPGER